MSAALLADIDELPAGEYLGEYDGIGTEGPIGKAWGEVDAALHSLTPDTPEAATAIHFAWLADEEAGVGADWDEPQVEQAKALAWATLPRAS